MRSRSTLIVTAIFSLLGFYLLDRLALITTTISNDTLLSRLNNSIDMLFPAIKADPFMISMDSGAITAGVCGFFAVWIFYIYCYFNSKNYMRGKEHGSAKWGTKRDSEPFKNKEDPDQNIILSATEQLNTKKAKNFEYDRNKNISVVGGSGSGKTHGFVKPNLMQLFGSYVVTDPKGTLLPDTGYLFTKNGYQLRWFNAINFKKSLHYNPLAYIHSEKDILKLVNVLIENTRGEGTQCNEDFWIKAERLWYGAAIGYLYYEAPPEDRNIPMLVKMLDLSGAREEDEEFQSAIDILFEELERENPDCFPVRQYKKFKQAAGKTLKSILVSCGARLAPFDIEELREIMSYDELELDQIGDRKTAFFVIMSDTDNTYSFVIAMMFYQMFNLLCDKADDEYCGVLPFPVCCILDEFANIGRIPNFEKLIATIRSRGISAIPILQSLAQLTAAYKEKADIILDNCDTLVFLGGKSTKTTKQISEMIGKTTVDNQNYNESKGQYGSYQINNSILGRDLIDPAEIGKLKRTECLVLINGTEPFKSRKYNTSKHKRFSYLADGGQPKFDVTAASEQESEHFLDNIQKVYEIDLSNITELKTLTGEI